MPVPLLLGLLICSLGSSDCDTVLVGEMMDGSGEVVRQVVGGDGTRN